MPCKAKVKNWQRLVILDLFYSFDTSFYFSWHHLLCHSRHRSGILFIKPKIKSQNLLDFDFLLFELFAAVQECDATEAKCLFRSLAQNKLTKL
jgi:hypothetical protein